MMGAMEPINQRITPLTVCSSNRVWEAHWIWPAGLDPSEANRVALFRCEVDLETDPAGCRLAITAIDRYRVWINGELVGDGPPPSALHHTYVDQYPVGDALRRGRNLIAVQAHSMGSVGGRSAGLLVELRDADGRLLTASDERWRSAAGAAWRADTYHFRMNKLFPRQEHCDGRLLPPGWNQGDGEAPDWPAAAVLRKGGCDRPPVAGPAINLVPRDIPHLERGTFAPEAVVAVERCTAVANRCESQDASIEACQPGLEAAADDPARAAAEALCRGADATLAPTSPRPHDPAWDGVRDPAVTLAFGELLTAWTEFECTAEPGTVVTITSAERLIDGRVQSTIESRFCERYVCRGGRQVFRSLAWHSFRYLRLRVSGPEKQLTLHALRAIRTRTPFPTEATFEADDGWVAISDLCRRTLRLCCVDSIMDTPWRESAQWLGDVAMVTVPGLHWVYGDRALCGKFLVQAGGNAGPDGLLSNLSNIEPQHGDGTIPDYSLWWLYGLREHRWASGEDRWYRSLYPEAVRVLRWFARFVRADGLVADVPKWIFIDWAPVPKRGTLSTLNALVAMGCDVVAEMAGVVGDADTRRWCDEWAETIRATFADRFVDPATGVVRDGDGMTTTSEHAQAAAVAFDCVTGDVAQRVVATCWSGALPEEMVECQPFFARVVLEALHHHGRRDLALALIEERWGRRFRDRGMATCGEEWTVNGSGRNGPWTGFMRTLSHAWSAGAAEFLVRRLPGIELLEPGGARVRVRPHAADFAYRVQVPVGPGTVSVDHAPGREVVVEASGGVVVEA